MKEAILFSRRIDEWLRYSSIATVIRKDFPDGCRIVDIGGTPWGLTFFLSPQKYSVTVANQFRLLRFGRSRRTNFVIADGLRLPFKDGAFDLAVSIDTLEHIPPKRRHELVDEMRRMAKDGLLLVPVEGQSGDYDARACDIKLAAFCKNRLGRVDQFMSEHIQLGVPTLESLQSLGIEVLKGSRSSKAWMSYMPLARSPLVGYLAGAIYLRQWYDSENRPPYYSALFRISRIPRIGTGGV